MVKIDVSTGLVATAAKESPAKGFERELEGVPVEVHSKH